MCTDSETPPAAGGKWVMDETAFERLLAWLDPERERAGRRYEDIRRRLIAIFNCRGCRESEDLADETINRVARRLAEMADTYTGDQALYFYGVARNVFREHLRKRLPPPPPPPPPPDPDDREREYDCLERCMHELPAENRHIMIEYYRGEGRQKIENRKRLAARLSIGANALRIRACRIREALYRCVSACLSEGAAG